MLRPIAHTVAFPMALACALSSGGCFGTEGGNPEPVPKCDSFVFGLLEGDFTVPSNAPGIPLQVSESLRSDTALVEARLEVTRNGVPETGFAVVSGSGATVPTDDIIRGRVMVTFVEPLTEGERIEITRVLDCDDMGTGHALPEQEVRVSVGPEAPMPDSAGDLTVSDGGDSTSVVLRLSDEVVPWLHLVSASVLHVGEDALGSGTLLDGADRDLDWRLAGGSCPSCSEDVTTDRDDGAPTVCYAHTWPAGTYELFVRAELFGVPGHIDSTIATTTFTEKRCSP